MQFSTLIFFMIQTVWAYSPNPLQKRRRGMAYLKKNHTHRGVLTSPGEVSNQFEYFGENGV